MTFLTKLPGASICCFRGYTLNLHANRPVLNQYILKYGEEFIDCGVAGESQDD
jgi:hypothetical protein